MRQVARELPLMRSTREDRVEARSNPVDQRRRPFGHETLDPLREHRKAAPFRVIP